MANNLHGSTRTMPRVRAERQASKAKTSVPRQTIWAKPDDRHEAPLNRHFMCSSHYSFKSPINIDERELDCFII